jgi:hypothetical protein
VYGTNRAPFDPARAQARRRILAAASAAVVAVATATVVAAPPASATPAPLGWAFSQFLTGSAGTLDLAGLPGVGGVGVSDATLPATGTLPIDSDTINALPTTIAGGLPLFGAGGVLNLGSGALNQVASAANNGDLLAATGAVTDAGVPDLGGLGVPATLDATGLLSRIPTVGDALTQLTVTLQGIASTATQATGNPSGIGSSVISGGTLTMASPILADIPSSVLDALAPVQTALDGLGGPNGGLADALLTLDPVQSVLTALGLASPTSTVSLTDSDLSSAVSPLLGQTLDSADGFVHLDVATGEITADLAGLFGGDLGGLAPNTGILTPTVLSGIASTVDSLVQDLISSIEDAVGSKIDLSSVSLTSTAGGALGLTSMDITTDGTIAQILGGTATTTQLLTLAGAPLTLSKSDLLAALSAPINTDVLDSAVPTFDGLLGSQVGVPTTDTLAPGVGDIGSLLSLTANAQSTLNGVLTQTGLLTTLLPGLDPLAILGLGSTSVGTTPAVAPTVTSLSPHRGPVAGGQLVTVAGANFVPGLTSVHIGGKTIAASAVNVNSSRTSLTFRTPSHSAAATTVTVQTPLGTSGALAYRYLPVPAAAALHPNAGPARGGRPLTVTGSGFVAGATSVRIGATTLGTGKVHVLSTTRLSITTPARPAGSVSVSVTTPGGTSNGRSYAYRRAPRLGALSAAHGSRTGGRLVTATGSSFVPAETGVRIGGKTLPATEVQVVSPSKLRFTTPAHTRGTVKVSVFTVGGVSGAKSFRYVPGAAITPRVRSLSASGGPTTGGQRLAVAGSGFVPGDTSLRMGAVTVGAASVNVVSPSRLWVRTPAKGVGKVDVRVITSGRASNPIGYSFVRPLTTPSSAPHITAPKSGAKTRNNAPFVSGSATAGATVAVLVDGVAYCTARVTGGGNWSCAGTAPLIAGRHRLRASQVTAGHSASRLTGAVTITVR